MTPTKATLLEWFFVRGDQLYWKKRPANRVKIGTEAGSANRTHSPMVSVPGCGRFAKSTLLEIINA